MLTDTWDRLLEEANALREVSGDGPLPRLSVSFSGGRTSAVMTDRLWRECQDSHELRITFCNTSCEDERTLEFVHTCETHFGWPVVWLEAVVDPRQGFGVRHKVVSYETASRHGEVFEQVVAKYGIFNQTKKSCTTRLKEDVIKSYLESCGWSFGKGIDHKTAVGIRADEIDRMSQTAVDKCGLIYSMVTWGITKRDVALAIQDWPFDLQIPGDHWGNCKWCWKKTDRKLYTLALEDESVFDVPKRLEQRYGHIDAEKGHKCCADDGRAYFFRGHRPAETIVKEANAKVFDRYVDDPYQHGKDPFEEPFDAELDLGAGCGESCEVWSDAN